MGVPVEFVVVEVLVAPVEFTVRGPVELGITGPGACVIPVGMMIVPPELVSMIEGMVSRLPVSSVLQ